MGDGGNWIRGGEEMGGIVKKVAVRARAMEAIYMNSMMLVEG